MFPVRHAQTEGMQIEERSHPGKMRNSVNVRHILGLLQKYNDKVPTTASSFLLMAIVSVWPLM